MKSLINELLEKDFQRRPDLLKIFAKENIKKKLLNFSILDEVVKLYPNLTNDSITIPIPFPVIPSSALYNPRKFIFPKLKIIEDKNPIYSLCFLKDGRLVSCGKKNAVIYSKSTDELNVVIDEGNSVYSVCGLRNGNLAYCGYYDIKTWEIKEKKMVYFLVILLI